MKTSSIKSLQQNSEISKIDARRKLQQHRIFCTKKRIVQSMSVYSDVPTIMDTVTDAGLVQNLHY